jgi:hypothetical protein
MAAKVSSDGGKFSIGGVDFTTNLIFTFKKIFDQN